MYGSAFPTRFKGLYEVYREAALRHRRLRSHAVIITRRLDTIGLRIWLGETLAVSKRKYLYLYYSCPITASNSNAFMRRCHSFRWQREGRNKLHDSRTRTSRMTWDLTVTHGNIFYANVIYSHTFVLIRLILAQIV